MHCDGNFLVGQDNFFGCLKSGKKGRDFPNVNGQDKISGQSSGSNDSPKKNNFYEFRSRGEQETSPGLGDWYVESLFH